MNIILITLSKLGAALETERQRQSSTVTDQIRNMIDRHEQKKLSFYSKCPAHPLINHDQEIQD